jgi:hypothetical protein
MRIYDQRFPLLAAVCHLTLVSVPVPAQTSSKILDFNPHGWYLYSGDHSVAGRWGVHFDGQWRRSNIATRWQQFQLRPGVNFQATGNILLTAGYAYTRTYPYGDFPVIAAFPEHRIYEQALVRHRRKSVTLLHRIRLEQRFIRYPSTQDRSWTYQNRFRYLLKGEIPLRFRRDKSGGWYLPVYDEILLGIPPNFRRPFVRPEPAVCGHRLLWRTRKSGGRIHESVSRPAKRHRI